MKKLAAIATMRPSLPTRVSRSSMVVVHAYPDHAHHTIPSTSRERAKPAALVSSRISEATCVIAKTKTRSKKSSR